MASAIYGPSLPLQDVLFSFMGVYSCWIDAAGKQGDRADKTLVAAGFVATVESWEHFERSWNEMLLDYRIPYLQMSALHARKKPFHEDRWNDEEYMKVFLSGVARIVRSHVLGFWAAGVGLAEFDAICRLYALAERFNAYAFCGTTALLKLQAFLNETRFDQERVEFFVEEGDDGIGMIQAEFRAKGLDEPIRRAGKPQRGKTHHVEFQACDWLAFETRKFAQKKPRQPIRICHAELLYGVPGMAQEWTIADMVRFCETQNIQRLEQ